MCYLSVQVSHSVMSNFFVTPQTAAHQASLSITNTWSLFKLMSIKWVMTSNHLILCCSLLLLPSIFPSIRVFSNSQFFTSGGQSVGASVIPTISPSRVTFGPLHRFGSDRILSEELSTDCLGLRLSSKFIWFQEIATAQIEYTFICSTMIFKSKLNREPFGSSEIWFLNHFVES